MTFVQSMNSLVLPASLHCLSEFADSVPMHVGLLLFISIIILFTTPVFASDEDLNNKECINGPHSQNTAFIDSIEASKDPLRQAYLNKNAATKKTEEKKTAPIVPEPPCIDTDTNKKQFSLFTNFAATIEDQFSSTVQEIFTGSTFEPATKISKECIAAAMKRNPGNKGYICKYPNDKEAKRGFNPKTQSVAKPYGKAGGSSVQCVTNASVDYMHFAVNSAIQCMSPEDPIDSRVIFRKLNNETGFNPSIAWKGGAGLGQMTSIATRELSSSVKGKGRYILKKLANSKNPACDGFRAVAKADLQKPPTIHSANFCAWVSPGDGLARNLIYSIGYYLAMRDQYVIPAVEKRSSSLPNFRELISDLTAISYGSEGLEQVKWLLQKFRVNGKTNAGKLESQVRKNSKYLANIKHKMQEMTCLKKGLNPSGNECKKMKLSENELEADTCVSK